MKKGILKNGGDNQMAKVDKNPSKRAVSAASVKGNAGPDSRKKFGKTQSTNQQYGAHNTDSEE